MQALKSLIVKMDTEFEETITHGSLKLFMPESAIDFNQHDNRVQSAVVYSAPMWAKQVKNGDRVWFNHNITTGHRNRIALDRSDKGQNVYMIDPDENLYFIPYTENKNLGYDCMAYVVEDENGIRTINDFMCCPKTEKYNTIKSDLWTPEYKEKGVDNEVVVKYSNEMIDGVNVGDTLGLMNESSMEIDVHGETLLVFRHREAIYKREGDEFTPVLNWIIFRVDKKTHTESGLEIPEPYRKFERTATVLKVGSTCTENNEGDNVILLRDTGVYRLYEDVFATRETNVVPQMMIKAIAEYGNNGII